MRTRVWLTTLLVAHVVAQGVRRAALLRGGSFGSPLLRTSPLVLYGNNIQVFFNTTDGYDGRVGFTPGMREHESRDWVGLFSEGSCDHREPNKHLRNKCFLEWQYVPVDKAHGHVFFHHHKPPEESGYKHAGNYELRYFYGENPNIANFFPGAMHQGCKLGLQIVVPPVPQRAGTAVPRG